MIIEVNDIAQGQKAFGHAQGLPEGATLGMLFQKHEGCAKDLSSIRPLILQCRINGRAIDNWETVRPGEHDRINFTIGPGGGIIEGLILAIQIISALVTIVQFIMSLFASPPPKPKQGKQESSAYGFEGLRDTFQLGSPIAVVYGEHRKGGQVLMYYLSMMPDNKGTRMNMLMSLGEGPVESVEDIEINGLPLAQIESASAAIRLGTSGQAQISGYSTIKNTFHDGREITDKQKNGLKIPNTSSIIYRTTGYDVRAIEPIVIAPNGLYHQSLEGAFLKNWSRYVIQYRRSEYSSLDESNQPWSTWDTRKFTGKRPIPYWDWSKVVFPRPDQWDVRFIWTGARRQKAIGRDQYTIHLGDVTEIRGTTGTFSNEVLLAIDACPTAQLNGGQPSVTARMKGLIVKNYTSVDSYIEQHTRNPAWCMVDWMTNSRYGMGADIPPEDIDIQSFLDFATLAESLAETCATSDQGCPRFGTDDFFDGFLFIDSKSPMSTDEQEFTLRSKFGDQTQNGIAYCQPCCPPDYGYGVNSADFLNSFIDFDLYIKTGVNTERPIFGGLCYVRSGTNQFSATMYGLIYNTVSANLLLCRWNGANPTTYGTILATFSVGLPTSGDELYLSVDQNYDQVGSYGGSNLVLNPYLVKGGATIVNTEILDSSASRIPHTVLDRAFGAIVLPNSASGTNHTIDLINFFGETGTCYPGIGHLGSHELTCVQNIPHYDAVR